MTVAIKKVRESGWRITFVVKDKTTGKVFTHMGSQYEGRTKKLTQERFDKWRAKKEAGCCVFTDVTEPKRFSEVREYLCF